MKKNGKKKKGIDPGFKLFLVAAPFLLVYFLLNYLPLNGWRYAFYNYKPGYALKDCEFVGLKHFASFFANPVMRRETIRVLRNTMAMSLIGMATSFLPMFFAISLNEVPYNKYKKFVQTVTTIPNFVSWVIVYSVISSMLSVESGLVNVILKELGLIDTGINFMATDKHVWLSMWLYSTWKGLGWSAVVYLAGIGSIDRELLEAASIDGAGRFQRIRYIMIPGLMPTFLTLFILSIGSLLSNGMDPYYIFQNAFNKSQIEVLDLYTYNLGIGNNNISLATAVGILKSVIGIILLFTANAISGKVREEKII